MPSPLLHSLHCLLFISFLLLFSSCSLSVFQFLFIFFAFLFVFYFVSFCSLSFFLSSSSLSVLSSSLFLFRSLTFPSQSSYVLSLPPSTSFVSFYRLIFCLFFYWFSSIFFYCFFLLTFLIFKLLSSFFSSLHFLCLSFLLLSDISFFSSLTEGLTVRFSSLIIIIMADWTDCLNFGISIAKQASEVSDTWTNHGTALRQMPGGGA